MTSTLVHTHTHTPSRILLRTICSKFILTYTHILSKDRTRTYIYMLISATIKTLPLESAANNFSALIMKDKKKLSYPQNDNESIAERPCIFWNNQAYRKLADKMVLSFDLCTVYIPYKRIIIMRNECTVLYLCHVTWAVTEPTFFYPSFFLFDSSLAM